MSTYLVRLTPQEPYFFGNEKNLEFKGQKNRGQMTNRYYIKSERTPLQTTLLGAMRYVFLKEKTFDLSNGRTVPGRTCRQPCGYCTCSGEGGLQRSFPQQKRQKRECMFEGKGVMAHFLS